jgi:hypothetical protein
MKNMNHEDTKFTKKNEKNTKFPYFKLRVLRAFVVKGDYAFHP